MKVHQARQQYAVGKLQNPRSRTPDLRARRHDPVSRHSHSPRPVHSHISAEHSACPNNQVIGRLNHAHLLPFHISRPRTTY